MKYLITRSFLHSSQESHSDCNGKSGADRRALVLIYKINPITCYNISNKSFSIQYCVNTILLVWFIPKNNSDLLGGANVMINIKDPVQE